MSRSILRGALAATAAALLLTGCTALPFTTPPLSHEVVLSVPSGRAEAVAEHLGHRLEIAGISERSIETDGDKVTVHYNPPRKDGKDQQVRADLFTAPGDFAIRPVEAQDNEAGASADCADDRSACIVTTDEDEVLELGPVEVTEKDLSTTKAVVVQNQWSVQVDFTKSGADAMAELSGSVACAADPGLKRMAILLDGTLLSAPTLQLECGQTLPGSVQIAGQDFDRDKAAQYAALMGTTLPDGVKVVSSKP
ncbi:hypothetical protein [Microbacterium sp. NPDC057650]|uniref:SecDF P1 head subdomain-containing protein n=1 Tax=unclassified Microbacterium TaxID=2609290 RepID=UPI003673052E